MFSDQGRKHADQIQNTELQSFQRVMTMVWWKIFMFVAVLGWQVAHGGSSLKMIKGIQAAATGYTVGSIIKINLLVIYPMRWAPGVWQYKSLVMACPVTPVSVRMVDTNTG